MESRPCKIPSAFPPSTGHGKHKPSTQSAVEAVMFPSCDETSRCLLSFNRTEFLGPLHTDTACVHACAHC